MMKKTMADEYLRRPYKRVLIPDQETGTYTGEISEFPGCVTEGRTPTEALRRLEAAAHSWIEAVLEMGQAVPEPMAEQEYSGKLMLRLSRSLHRRAAEMSHAEGVSLNQFIVTTLAERMGAGAKATTQATVSPLGANPSITLVKSARNKRTQLQV
ncbi:MAG: type II toxin-antitoxin system HicB family antitoxin [Pseudomonadota bacterium]|nr:type II toxin-antitoxin system HicB family antitoxin [Pseudomonadota bacterium]